MCVCVCVCVYICVYIYIYIYGSVNYEVGGRGGGAFLHVASLSRSPRPCIIFDMPL